MAQQWSTHMAGSLTSMLGWGAVGGALPTISKVAGTYGANFAAPAPEWRGVLIAIALYAGIGSVVARAMDNPEMKQALFAGIAAPAIVASILAGVTDSRSVNPASAQTYFRSNKGRSSNNFCFCTITACPSDCRLHDLRCRSRGGWWSSGKRHHPCRSSFAWG